MNKGIAGAVLAIAALLALSGCKDTGNGGLKRPRTSERPEYDCLKHAKDNICEVPWKDKIILYCVKGKVKRVVRYREDC